MKYQRQQQTHDRASMRHDRQLISDDVYLQLLFVIAAMAATLLLVPRGLTFQDFL